MFFHYVVGLQLPLFLILGLAGLELVGLGCPLTTSSPTLGLNLGINFRNLWPLTQQEAFPP